MIQIAVNFGNDQCRNVIICHLTLLCASMCQRNRAYKWQMYSTYIGCTVEIYINQEFMETTTTTKECKFLSKSSYLVLFFLAVQSIRWMSYSYLNRCVEVTKLIEEPYRLVGIVLSYLAISCFSVSRFFFSTIFTIWVLSYPKRTKSRWKISSIFAKIWAGTLFRSLS